MKTLKIIKVLVVLAALVGTSAFAVIANSKHDLSTGSTNGGIRAAGSGVDEICVFCHTPHGANSTFTGAPIWNKETSTAQTGWTMYGTTIGGTDIDTQSGGAPSDSSKACLSCHDGVSAVNSLQNAPGSGLAGVGAQMDGQYAKMLLKGGGAAGTGAESLTDLGADAAVNLGGGTATADLSNDHPISVTYDATKASLKATTATLTSWITPGAGTTIADVLKSGKVECGTCHDPHEVTNGRFLRASNTASALCLSCHQK